jgi:Uma2 family endonuclease
MSTTVAEERLTVAEFLRKYGHCSGVELVRGRVVWSARPRSSRVPQEAIPEDPKIAPELVIEVRSPTDRWSQLFAKVGEYLGAGVLVVVIIDPNTETVSVYRDDGRQQILTTTDELTLPDVLPGFAVPVARFFE